MLHDAGTGTDWQGRGVGWNREQLAALGIAWPPMKGWLSRLIGRRVPRKMWERFMSLSRRKSP
jgi:hypothetical protein